MYVYIQTVLVLTYVRIHTVLVLTYVRIHTVYTHCACPHLCTYIYTVYIQTVLVLTYVRIHTVLVLAYVRMHTVLVRIVLFVYTVTLLYKVTRYNINLSTTTHIL
jgi:hypothetical protein